MARTLFVLVVAVLMFAGGGCATSHRVSMASGDGWSMSAFSNALKPNPFEPDQEGANGGQKDVPQRQDKGVKR